MFRLTTLSLSIRVIMSRLTTLSLYSCNYVQINYFLSLYLCNFVIFSQEFCLFIHTLFPLRIWCFFSYIFPHLTTISLCFSQNFTLKISQLYNSRLIPQKNCLLPPLKLEVLTTEPIPVLTQWFQVSYPSSYLKWQHNPPQTALTSSATYFKRQSIRSE